MKFGGTSVANVDKIQNVAKTVVAQSKNNKILVVLSAMAGVTNQLQAYIDEINSTSLKKISSSIETDMVMTSGEQVTVGLLSMILNTKGIKSLPLVGWQIPIITDSNFEKSRILNIKNENIHHYFKSYDVLVVAGFQGVNIEGVFTTDPNIEKYAKKIDKVAYEEMLEMSSTGAKVLQTRSVELAMKNNLTLQVLSSLTNKKGTYIINEDALIEKEIVSGVSYSKNESKISISGIPDKPGISAKIFGLMASNNINVDMIVQNISQDGISANITFTVPLKDLENSKNIINNNKDDLNYDNLSIDSNIAKISVIGMGMMSQSGVAEKMFKALAENKINILAISTSEIKISVLIHKKYTELAIKSLHSVYKLGKK